MKSAVALIAISAAGAGKAVSGQSWALCATVVAVLVFLAWVTGRASRTENLAELIRAARGQRRRTRQPAGGPAPGGGGRRRRHLRPGRTATAVTDGRPADRSG